MNCSGAKFYENYLTSNFHTNTVIFKTCHVPTRQNGVGNRDKSIITASEIYTEENCLLLGKPRNYLSHCTGHEHGLPVCILNKVSRQ